MKSGKKNENGLILKTHSNDMKPLIKHWRGSFAIFETGIKHLRVCLPYLKLESNSGVGHFATFETGMKHLGGNFAIFETCSTVIKPLKGSFWHV